MKPCPICSNPMVMAKATAFGEEYAYCRTCKKELSEMPVETPKSGTLIQSFKDLYSLNINGTYPPVPPPPIGFRKDAVVICADTSNILGLLTLGKRYVILGGYPLTFDLWTVTVMNDKNIPCHFSQDRFTTDYNDPRLAGCAVIFGP